MGLQRRAAVAAGGGHQKMPVNCNPSQIPGQPRAVKDPHVHGKWAGSTGSCHHQAGQESEQKCDGSRQAYTAALQSCLLVTSC